MTKYVVLSRTADDPFWSALSKTYDASSAAAAAKLRHVDHINGDKLDNRRANLRIATAFENAQNRHVARGASSHRGVVWHKGAGKWMAQAHLAGVQHYLGLFDREEDAAKAAAAFRAEHMPFSPDAAEVALT